MWQAGHASGAKQVHHRPKAPPRTAVPLKPQLLAQQRPIIQRGLPEP